MAKPPRKSDRSNPGQRDQETPPDIERHDEVFFRHASGPKCGRVLSRGTHGCVIEADGARHRVRFADIHGHKVRVRPEVKVVDQGEDGMLVEDTSGRRRFISDPLGSEEPGPKPIAKSLMPVVLITSSREAMMKAMGREVKNRPGLALQAVTDKAGHQTKRWKKTGQDPHHERPKGHGEDDAGASRGYGTHNLEPGDSVDFKLGSLTGQGEIVATGAKGATVRDSEGHPHKVTWDQITGHKPSKGSEKTGGEAEAKSEVKPEPKPVPAESFKAADYAAEHDDAEVTPEAILASFPADTADRIAEVQNRLKAIEQTIETHKSGDAYGEKRAELHKAIIGEFLSPERLAKARPEGGAKPVLTMLGGRGGSGKGAFKGEVYDPEKAVVIDADEIKARLPEYEGWNAHQVHEESADIVEAIIDGAMRAGVNVVLDATMKSMGGAMARVDQFEKDGYDIHAHYMHLPRQEAAKRAVQRFLGKTQRYVPIDVVLSNTDNEKVFDAVRDRAKVWSFRDNNVAKGQPPVIISQSGD